MYCFLITYVLFLDIYKRKTRDLLTLILARVPSHVAHIALSCNASLGLEASWRVCT